VDLRLSPEQEQLVDAIGSLLTKHGAPEQVRAAEPLGFDPALWEKLVELGVVAMGVGEAAGGWGASMVDLALVAEQIGRSVAPAPVIEVQVAARLLERLGGDEPSAVLASVLGEGRLVTTALHPVRGDEARLAPAGAISDAVLVWGGEEILAVPLDPAPTQVANLGSLPAADVRVPADAPVLASGPVAAAAFEAALDDWLTLTAAALVGLGQRALEIGVDYVKERHAWGVPIGSFQAIAHRLADSATAVDAALLVAREAAWAADAEPARYGELAAMAFALAHEAARDASYRSLHFHGGYGFMMEYDIQLYYRRARAWAQVFGGPSVVHRRIADQRYGRVDAAS
jgi:alkylation response protein AidB-like acyl-CoA dehydrogenase